MSSGCSSSSSSCWSVALHAGTLLGRETVQGSGGRQLQAVWETAESDDGEQVMKWKMQCEP